MVCTCVEKEELVRKGYDVIAEKYHASRRVFDNTRELEAFANLLPKNAKVLDVGCGAGVPVTKFLVDAGYTVTGVDFSDRMLSLAARNVPDAHYVKKNMTALAFKDNTFHGLTACYSIIHVPREKHRTLFQTFHRILTPSGILLVSLGSSDWEGIDDFHGTPMFWSHYAPSKSVQIVTEASFEIVDTKLIVEGGEKHYWVLAKNIKE